MRTPEFWRHDGVLARALAPLGWAYRAGAAVRGWSAEGWRAPVPVICVGNLVAGGAGKTPVALSIAERVADLGVGVHFLTRGYGGRISGPVLVDSGVHTARDVGDEPLLLARRAPTWVAHDRAAGARAAVAAGAGAIVMDDGHQNPSLIKDLAIVVIDGSYGFGNARVLPAGPLREPLAQGLDRAGAIVIVGTNESGAEALLPPRVPCLRARIVPVRGAAHFGGERVAAFAGIGHPEKFFATLAEMGCDVVAARPFGDHHLYTEAEIESLSALAAREDAVLLTTAKDAVRLPAAARDTIGVIEIDVEWAEPERLTGLLLAALRAEMTCHG